MANDTYEKCRMKANQEWEMAGLARQDGDKADCARHTEKAREWDAKAQEALKNETT